MATKWACPGIADETSITGEPVYLDGRTKGDEHYIQSQWSQVKTSDTRVAELVKRMRVLAASSERVKA
jgi:hypothetical protein